MNVTTLPDSVNPLIIGAGQAGLVLSGMLSRANHEHLVLEARDSLGGGWQDRWDSFTIVTPNWVTSLPGLPYDGMPARRPVEEELAETGAGVAPASAVAAQVTH